MCECGCPDSSTTQAVLEVASETFVIVQRYPGCTNCDAPIGVDVIVSRNRAEVEEMYGTPTTEFDSAYACSVPFFRVTDLEAVGREWDERDPSALEDCETMEFLMEEHGEEIIRRAIATMDAEIARVKNRLEGK